MNVVNPGTFAWAFAQSILRRICRPKNHTTETREHCITRSIMICILLQILWHGQVKDSKMNKNSTEDTIFQSPLSEPQTLHCRDDKTESKT